MLGMMNPITRLTMITGSIPTPTARLKNGGMECRYRNPNTNNTPRNPKIAPDAPAEGTSG